MTQISAKPEAAPRLVRGVRRTDLSARLKGRVRSLRSRLERRDALEQVVREANATLDSRRIAEWLVRQAHGWLPAPAWAVVGNDTAGQPAVLAEEGLTPALSPAVWSAAQWVLRHHTELFAADLARELRQGDISATVLGFPLVCRQRTIGALVGLDPAPSAAPPSLGTPLVLTLRTILEPVAIALDNSLALQRAEALSVTDDLTRLYNSRYLNLVLRRETKRASRSGRPLSVLFLDLDGFKQVNDQYGHLAGSKALVEAGAIIKGCARETDVVGRFGGDEFCVILPDTGRDGAHAVAARIRERLSGARFLTDDGLSVHLTASIGVATLPDVAGSAEELVRAADMAMYKVKAGGKNGIHIAQEE